MTLPPLSALSKAKNYFRGRQGEMLRSVLLESCFRDLRRKNFGKDVSGNVTKGRCKIK